VAVWGSGGKQKQEKERKGAAIEEKKSKTTKNAVMTVSQKQQPMLRD